MSRTDKDVPWWVQAEYWFPQHSFWCKYRDLPCTLPPAPRLVNPIKVGRKTCYWRPEWPPNLRNWGHNPPRSFITEASTAPTRRKVRDDCRRAAAEYRATGEVDIIPPINQDRHCATWLYW